jgi:hypothetical protein
VAKCVLNGEWTLAFAFALKVAEKINPNDDIDVFLQRPKPDASQHLAAATLMSRIVRKPDSDVTQCRAFAPHQITDGIIWVLPLTERISNLAGFAISRVEHKSQCAIPGSRHPGKFKLQGWSIKLPGAVVFFKFGTMIP